MSSPPSPPIPVHLTIEEYERLQEPDDYRSELERGLLLREPRPGAYHGRTQTRLARRLEEFVEREKLGVVLTDVGVVLSRRPPTVRGPDAAFYSSERLPELPRGFLEVAPDLAIEVVSPSNTVRDIGSTTHTIRAPASRYSITFSTTSESDGVPVPRRHQDRDRRGDARRW